MVEVAVEQSSTPSWTVWQGAVMVPLTLTSDLSGRDAAAASTMADSHQAGPLDRRERVAS